MEWLSRIVLWSSLVFVLYTYLLYPLLVATVGHLSRPSAIAQDGSGEQPSVTVIIPAHNEEKWIKLKIENTLDLDYPRSLMDILVASDASSDRTVEIAERYERENVRVVHFEERTGKITTLGRVMDLATGDIVLMTDASAMLEPQALALMVKHFGDPTVGCVAGDRVCSATGSSATDGESLYLRYERWIKESENRIQSCLGGYGPILAVRRCLLPTFTGSTDDFYIPMKILLSVGARTVFDPHARASIPAAATLEQEFNRKIRTHLAFICDLPRLRQALNPLKSKIWWQLWSHQVTRLFVPVAMLAALVSSAMLWRGGPVYRALFLGQLALYAMATTGLAMSRRGLKWKPAYVCFYFVFANAAVGLAWIQWAWGKRPGLWRRTERLPPGFASQRDTTEEI